MNNLSKIFVSPSKQVSIGSVIGLIFLLLFGIAFAVLVGGVLAENEAPLIMSIVFYLFMTGWIGTVLIIMIYHIKNLKNAKGLSLFNINAENGLNNNELTGTPKQRLQDLESMKKEGLINEIEYQQKRTQIMEEKW